MADCRGIQRMPEWVPHSLAVMRATEQFLLTGWEALGSEQLLGSWAALSWLGTSDDDESRAPVTAAAGRPTRPQMDMEAEFALELSEGNPYPQRSWWARYNPAVTAGLDEAWWDRRIVLPEAREYHHGAMIALLWVAQPGAVAPIMFAPFRRGDGEDVKRATREWAGDRLAGLWAAAAKPPAEPVRSAGQVRPARS